MFIDDEVVATRMGREAFAKLPVGLNDIELRDGTQCPGASVNPREGLEIARQSERLGSAVIEAGFPEHIFQSVVVDHAVAKHIMQHNAISGVTLTGSERAGSIVASQAGSALKKVVLELGGSDPYIILADADLEKAAEQIVKSRLNNSGQVCIAAKRIIADFGATCLFLNALSTILAFGAVTAKDICVSSLF